MRKEIILVIIFGTLFGLIMAFGIWRANSALKSTKEATSNGQNIRVEENITSSVENPGLVIAKPENDDVLTESNTIITGITKPANTVIISSETEDYIIHSNESGTFEQKIDLVGGINNILIYSYDNEGLSTDTKLRLIYSKEFAQYLN